MKPGTQRILNKLTWRFARNIYFILFLLFIRVTNSNFSHAPAGRLLLLAITLFQLYFNNLVLVPYLLARKRYITYFISLLVVTMGNALLNAYFIGVIKGLSDGQQKMEGFKIYIKDSEQAYSSFTINAGSQFIMYMILTFIFTVCWYVMDYQKKQGELEAERKRQVETELSFLKAQMNPHFLFNTLNNVYGLAVKKSDLAPDAILKLSSILRYLLYESNTIRVSFEKEKEVMQAYIDLELLRLTDKSKVYFSVTADNAYSIPPLLWLPVLENVFKHGTRFIADSYDIGYRFSIVNNKLTIYSRNRYKPGQVHEAGGLGISNLRKRLDLLFPGKHSIDMSRDENYATTKVEVELT